MHVVILIVRADGRAIAIALLIVVWLRLRSAVAAFVLRRGWVVVRNRLIRISAAIIVARCAAAIAVVWRTEGTKASVAGRLIARLVIAAIGGRGLPVIPIGILAGIWPAIGRTLLVERARASVCDGHGVIRRWRLYAAVRRSAVRRIVCA